jgi:hypothetical protein
MSNRIRIPNVPSMTIDKHIKENSVKKPVASTVKVGVVLSQGEQRWSCYCFHQTAVRKLDQYIHLWGFETVNLELP